MTIPSEDFPKLIGIFGRMIQGVKGKKLSKDESWKDDGQLLLIKAYRHFESIETLRRGIVSTIGDVTYPHYIDHSSIAVLARSAFETYLMFHFIFCQGKPEQRRLRHRIWRMCGLRDRQRLQGPAIRSEWGRQVIESEKKSIEKLEKLVRSDPLFRALPKTVQEKVFKSNADPKMGLRWTDLAELAGFPRKYGHDLYNLLCNYAHANAISVFQIRDAMNEGEFEMLARVTVSFCSAMMALIIVNYARLMPEAQDAMYADPEAIILVDRWCDMLGRLDMYYRGEK